VLPGRVLRVVDELVARCDARSIVGHRRQPRQDDRGHAGARGVVHAAAQILGTHIDVDERDLRLPRDHRVAMSRRQCRHLVRTDDDSRHRASRSVHPRKRFDEGRMITAEVAEHVFDVQAIAQLEQLLRSARHGFSWHGSMHIHRKSGSAEPENLRSNRVAGLGTPIE